MAFERELCYVGYMQLNKVQLDPISKYFADISKILFASTVIGFFIPNDSAPVTIQMLIAGSFVTAVTLWMSMRFLK